MAVYTYLFYDLLSNTALAELPCFSVSFDRAIGKASNCQFSLHLDQDGLPNTIVLGATTPGKTALYIDRDGKLVWGGIIWTRTYQSNGKALEFTAQTFESYASRRLCRVNKSFTGIDSRNILLDLYAGLMLDEGYSNIGVTVPAQFTDNPLFHAQLVARDFEFRTYQDLLDTNAQGDNGPEYYIEPQYDGSGIPQKILIVGSLKVGNPVSASGLVFEYPGSVADYTFPENVSSAGNRHFALGAGDSTLMLWSEADNTATYVSGGYPLIDDVVSYKDVSVQSTLDAYARQAARTNQIPISPISIMTKAETVPVYGSYNLGDYFRFDVTDPRWPAGLIVNAQRIIGWTVVPSSSQSVETVNLVLESDQSA
jgi:hypothetical protein